MFSRRHLLKAGVLAPFAPLAAAASQKLGAMGSTIQKVTPQSAVQKLVENLSRGVKLNSGDRVVVEDVKYVGDIAIVRLRETWFSPSYVEDGIVKGGAMTSHVSTRVFNAGNQAIHYLNHIVPPGKWFHIFG